jgi:hypothetical protein
VTILIAVTSRATSHVCASTLPCKQGRYHPHVHLSPNPGHGIQQAWELLSSESRYACRTAPRLSRAAAPICVFVVIAVPPRNKRLFPAAGESSKTGRRPRPTGQKPPCPMHRSVARPATARTMYRSGTSSQCANTPPAHSTAQHSIWQNALVLYVQHTKHPHVARHVHPQQRNSPNTLMYLARHVPAPRLHARTSTNIRAGRHAGCGCVPLQRWMACRRYKVRGATGVSLWRSAALRLAKRWVRQGCDGSSCLRLAEHRARHGCVRGWGDATQRNAGRNAGRGGDGWRLGRVHGHVHVHVHVHCTCSGRRSGSGRAKGGIGRKRLTQGACWMAGGLCGGISPERDSSLDCLIDWRTGLRCVALRAVSCLFLSPLHSSSVRALVGSSTIRLPFSLRPSLALGSAIAICCGWYTFGTIATTLRYILLKQYRKRKRRQHAFHSRSPAHRGQRRRRLHARCSVRTDRYGHLRAEVRPLDHPCILPTALPRRTTVHFSPPYRIANRPQHRRRLHPTVRQAGQGLRGRRLHLHVRKLHQQTDVLQQLHGQRGAAAGAEPGDAVLPGRGAVSLHQHPNPLRILFSLSLLAGVLRERRHRIGVGGEGKEEQLTEVVLIGSAAHPAHPSRASTRRPARPLLHRRQRPRRRRNLARPRRRTPARQRYRRRRPRDSIRPRTRRVPQRRWTSPSAV